MAVLVKTLNGLTYASVKTKNGIATSSLKTINGLDVTAAGGDPNWANVTLLLHCDGTDGSTSFPDNSDSAHTVTATGDAQIDTAEFKFGTGSALFDGNTDGLTVPNSSDFDFDSGDFTIECWIRTSSLAANEFIINKRSGGATGWALLVTTAGAVQWQPIGQASLTSSAGLISVDTWHHVALTYSGTTTTIWVDGVSGGSGTRSALTANAVDMMLGRRNDSASGYWTGWIDEVRVTTGVARYTANFTPPSAAFPDF